MLFILNTQCVRFYPILDRVEGPDALQVFQCNSIVSAPNEYNKHSISILLDD
jgi:hypothetical protein